ncbi:hypothetical protein GTA08_BOTSDO00256 [Botryosphaeria dothidea]|uniref:Uncharacterized protein n=1 Tax=Botryosphaeria dothidea TaxID=55169 RepID=A0A8H4NAL7_9PEZI|nr:hypothetical protein GTA08_BOTSDO00256 [Botryosphaeria dothidea]
MFRGPSYGGRSKATPSTTCQNYECKASAQERPYLSRPSRTQQLLNPKLKPQLTSDVPNDLLRKKGVADETLAKKADERGRKHSRDDDDMTSRPRKRSRSVSSYSSTSVSTISTNRSPTRSPSPPRREASKRARRSPAGDEQTTGGARKNATLEGDEVHSVLENVAGLEAGLSFPTTTTCRGAGAGAGAPAVTSKGQSLHTVSVQESLA